MTDTIMQANQVPLVERLRSVPANAHLAVNTPNPLGHDTQHFAIGAMCHKAAARLDDLREELEAARADAEPLRDAANRIEGDDVLARLRSGNATPEDQYNVANSLAYLWAQDGLLSEAQQEVDQLRDQLAEVERPLDEQMARLNANLVAANRARMDAERELEAAKRDAERYRWLRDDALQLLVSGPICVAADKWGKPLTQHPGNNSENGPALHITLDGKELDAAIDAAIERAAGGER